MRGNTVHFLKDSWPFSFKITEKATRISFEKPQLHAKCITCVRVILY